MQQDGAEMPTVRRTTSGQHRARKTLVETRTAEGWVSRGWIRPAGVDDMHGAGLAGHFVWHVMDTDGTWLDPVTGNYTDAEKALLEATKELENR